MFTHASISRLFSLRGKRADKKLSLSLFLQHAEQLGRKFYIRRGKNIYELTPDEINTLSFAAMLLALCRTHKMLLKIFSMLSHFQVIYQNHYLENANAVFENMSSSLEVVVESDEKLALGSRPRFFASFISEMGS